MSDFINPNLGNNEGGGRGRGRGRGGRRGRGNRNNGGRGNRNNGGRGNRNNGGRGDNAEPRVLAPVAEQPREMPPLGSIHQARVHQETEFIRGRGLVKVELAPYPGVLGTCHISEVVSRTDRNARPDAEIDVLAFAGLEIGGEFFCSVIEVAEGAEDALPILKVSMRTVSQVDGQLQVNTFLIPELPIRELNDILDAYPALERSLHIQCALWLVPHETEGEVNSKRELLFNKLVETVQNARARVLTDIPQGERFREEEIADSLSLVFESEFADFDPLDTKMTIDALRDNYCSAPYEMRSDETVSAKGYFLNRLRDRAKQHIVVNPFERPNTQWENGRWEAFNPFERFGRQPENPSTYALRWIDEISDGISFEVQCAFYATKNKIKCWNPQCRQPTLAWGGGSSAPWCDMVCDECSAIYEIKTKNRNAIESMNSEFLPDESRNIKFGTIAGGSLYHLLSLNPRIKKYIVIVDREPENGHHNVHVGEIDMERTQALLTSRIFKQVNQLQEHPEYHLSFSTNVSFHKGEIDRDGDLPLGNNAWFQIPHFGFERSKAIAMDVFTGLFPTVFVNEDDNEYEYEDEVEDDNEDDFYEDDYYEDDYYEDDYYNDDFADYEDYYRDARPRRSQWQERNDNGGGVHQVRHPQRGRLHRNGNQD